MFSLCIPTMDRYDNFLKKYLPVYLNNELVDEIIISDENGNDASKINRDFPNNPKIRIHINPSRLGPFLNKINCCKMSKNEWIVLMDSDNFADKNYFSVGKDFIERNCLNKNTILAPSWAKPNFNYTKFSNVCINKHNIKNYPRDSFTTLMNTGNYIINKYLITNINLINDHELIINSSACDVILFNLLLFEQLDLNMYVVPNLFYNHIVHNGSIYTNTVSQTRKYVNLVHNRYYSLFL